MPASPDISRANVLLWRELLAGYSLEMTASQTAALTRAEPLAAAGTLAYLAYLPKETDAARLDAAIQARTLGFVPVPHLAARRIPDAASLHRYLSALVEQAAVQQVFVLGGDPAQAVGPYPDALALLRSGALAEYGIRRVSIAGYPDGHPQIAAATLWQALEDKCRTLDALGYDYDIVTQFGFHIEPIVTWLSALRTRGITAPVRLGIAGPVSVQKLLRLAALCGVNASTSLLRKYGISLTRLFDTAGPERLLDALRTQWEPQRHGVVRLHFFPFGDMEKTLRWIHTQTALS